VDVVLNWVAQGVIVAILAAAALRLIPRARAQARYGVLWTAYVLVLALPAVSTVLTIAVGGPTRDLVPAVASPVVTMPPTWWASPAAAVGLWMVWSCIQAVRLAVSAFGVRNARRRGRKCPATVLARLPHWSRISVTGRRTRVILSDEVRAAAVLGCGTPTIALAPTLIEQLSVTDLDRVLVHEWAHVQRRDDLAQLAQRIARIVVGWHPAAWWLEQQLEFEREAACDEIVVSVTGFAKGYATCLAMLAVRPEPRVRSVAALAAASPSHLRARIVRILAAPNDAAARPWRAITVGGGGGLLACTLVVANLQLVASAVTSAVASTAAYPPHPEPVVRHLAVASRSAERIEPGPSRRPRRAFVARWDGSRAEARRPGSRGNQRPATHEASPRVDKTEVVGEPLISPEGFTPLQASALSVDSSRSLTATTGASERPLQAADERPAPALTASPERGPGGQPHGPWTRAADVGVDVGRASHTAGTATAGFFRRFGKKLAGAL
jgi:beta-lactamase regulating signal transducer with metallopeptidase domain